MTLDSGNRSFLTLLALSFLALHLTLGAAACVVLSLLAYELAAGGLDALADADATVWPAIVFLAVVGAGAVAGLRSLAIQLRASHELVRRVSALSAPSPPVLLDAARRGGVAHRVRMLDSSERFSFAYGAISPRIAISRGLVEAASPAELDAVLAHERYHVHNLDPLKVVLARALPAALFYLPALRYLRRRYVAGRELAADRRAVSSCGTQPLVGALLKVVEAPRWPELGAAAAIGGPGLLDIRIAQLETGTEPPPARMPPRVLLLSAAGLAVVAGALTMTVLSFGGVDAVVRETMPGARLGPLDLAMAFGCVLPWLAGGSLAYRWLLRRARAA